MLKSEPDQIQVIINPIHLFYHYDKYIYSVPLRCCGVSHNIVNKVTFYTVARQTPAFLCDAGICIGRLTKFLNDMNSSRALYTK